MGEEQDQVGHVGARGTGYDQVAERAEERIRVVVVEELLGLQSEGARPCHGPSVDNRAGGLRVAVRAIRAAGEEHRGPALQEFGGRQREFLVAPSPASAADRDGRLSSGDDRDRSRGGIPSKSLRNHDRSRVTSLSFHRGGENVRGIAPSLRFLPRRLAGPSVLGHDHVVYGAGGRRGPNFAGLRGRPKNALHGRGHRIPQTVPLEDRLRPLTPPERRTRRRSPGPSRSIRRTAASPAWRLPWSGNGCDARTTSKPPGGEDGISWATRRPESGRRRRSAPFDMRIDAFPIARMWVERPASIGMRFPETERRSPSRCRASVTARSGSTLSRACWKIARAWRRRSRRTEGVAREDSAVRATVRTGSRSAPAGRAVLLSGRRRGGLGSLILEPE